MTDTTAVVHFYDWENCELACDAEGIDTSDPAVAEIENVERVNCPDCLARLDAMRRFLAGEMDDKSAPAPVVDEDGTEHEQPSGDNFKIVMQADGTMVLNPTQATWIIETVTWNVDFDTVRFDNQDTDRADFLAKIEELYRRD